MKTIAAETNNLRSTLYPNLSCSVLTLLAQAVSIEPYMKLAKQYQKQVGAHELLKPTVIQLTLREYSLLKSSFSSVESFLQFVRGKQCQTKLPRPNDGTRHCSAEATPKVLSFDAS